MAKVTLLMPPVPSDSVMAERVVSLHAQPAFCHNLNCEGWMKGCTASFDPAAAWVGPCGMGRSHVPCALQAMCLDEKFKILEPATMAADYSVQKCKMIDERYKVLEKTVAPTEKAVSMAKAGYHSLKEQ